MPNSVVRREIRWNKFYLLGGISFICLLAFAVKNKKSIREVVLFSFRLQGVVSVHYP